MPPADHWTTSALLSHVRPGRRIDGCSAVLLPFTERGEIDWAGFARLLERTAAAGLTPAVNMDTGYVQLLDPADKLRVLDLTAVLPSERVEAA